MILMKKILLIFFLFLTVAAFAQIDKVIPPKPSPARLVNDFTNTLTASQKEALEQKLVAFDDSSSSQVAIVIIPTTGDYTIEEVGLEIGRRWGVGNKDINNGVILLIAKNDRKVRIEVGYGLEGALPDITAKNIIDNEIIPNFKQDNYYRGIDRGTDAIIKATQGEYEAPANYGKRKDKIDSLKTWLIIAIILFIVIGGMMGGSAGGTYVSRGGYRGWRGGGWIGGGGGGWSGGGGGGGFGGFGGGSFGGGGSSGSW
jgi:uncharacterized protein